MCGSLPSFQPACLPIRLSACLYVCPSLCLSLSHLVYTGPSAAFRCLLVNKSRAQSYAKRLKILNAFRQFVFVFIFATCCCYHLSPGSSSSNSNICIRNAMPVQFSLPALLSNELTAAACAHTHHTRRADLQPVANLSQMHFRPWLDQVPIAANQRVAAACPTPAPQPQTERASRLQQIRQTSMAAIKAAKWSIP